MLEIILDNKSGSMWDISSITSGLSWSTTRTGRPASIDFSIILNAIYQDSAFSIHNGDIVRVRKDGVNMFYGYVFSIQNNQDGEVSVKAYDQVRYLLSKATYEFKGKTAAEIIKQLATDFQLTTGRLDNPSYAIPAMSEDGQTLLDIIEKSVTLTLINTQRHYVFFDDFGELSLRLVDDFLMDFYIGDGSLLTGYSYGVDIDSDTYNRIKLYQDNKDTGRREEYGVEDSANIARWGLLQLYQSVDEKKNAAQINEMLAQLAQLKNRESRSLQLDAIGDIRIRAGVYVPVVIQSLGINQPMLVDEAKHSFNGDDHTMTLNLKVI
ncbi:MAG: phage-like element protein XkdQ [Paenibacillaceae bacterium]|nr:phage-like element protein XkdQ [Paenibacillaceae bacterium]